MDLYQTINTREYKMNDISLYLESEIAEELIDEIYENDEYIENFEYHEEVLDENDIVILSRLRNTNKWFVEPLSYEDGQIYNETDICFIQSDILDELDFDKIECNEFVVLNFENEFEEEESDLLDEVTNDILEELADMDDDECPHCKIKLILESLVETIEEDTLDRVIDKIGELYKNN